MGPVRCPASAPGRKVEAAGRACTLAETPVSWVALALSTGRACLGCDLLGPRLEWTLENRHSLGPAALGCIGWGAEQSLCFCCPQPLYLQ